MATEGPPSELESTVIIPVSTAWTRNSVELAPDGTVERKLDGTTTDGGEVRISCRVTTHVVQEHRAFR